MSTIENLPCLIPSKIRLGLLLFSLLLFIILLQQPDKPCMCLSMFV